MRWECILHVFGNVYLQTRFARRLRDLEVRKMTYRGFLEQSARLEVRKK